MNPEHLPLLLTRTMPYGKYKGRVIASLPGTYLNWFAREGFPPGEIGQLLAFAELGMEAIYEFEVEDMPATVAVDAKGRSIHRIFAG